MVDNQTDAAVPRIATLTKDQIWAEIESGTRAELEQLDVELTAHGYSPDGRAVSRIRARLATLAG